MPYANKIPCPKCGKLIQSRKSKQCNDCRLKALKTTGFSEEHKKKLGEAKMAEKNHMWRGDKVGYGQLHKWVKKRKKKPKFCECCNKKPALDLANISGEYKRDVNDWEYLCRRCHMKKDGRLKSFVNSKRNKKI